jgi:hypothetical protein
MSGLAEMSGQYGVNGVVGPIYWISSFFLKTNTVGVGLFEWPRASALRSWRGSAQESGFENGCHESYQVGNVDDIVEAVRPFHKT